MCTDLSVTSRGDDEEAAQIKAEWDELHQWDAESHQWIIALLSKAKNERELKLSTEDELVALEAKVRQDATMIERLRRERDESRKIEERLRIERSTIHTERDMAIQERDTTQHQIRFL